KTVSAALGADSAVTAGDVAITADSAETATTFSIGLGIGGTAGAAGALSAYAVTDTTTALIGSSAIVLAQDNVAVLANDATDLSFVSGGVAGGGSVAVGASIGVVVINNTTHASIADNASVTALGLGAGVDYITGYAVNLGAYGTATATTIAAPGTGSQHADTSGSDPEVLSAGDATREGLRLLAMQRTSAPTLGNARGVIVNASAGNSVEALSVGAAISGAASIAVSAVVPVITSDTEATIADGARINQDNDSGVGAGQSVIVAAASDLYQIGVAGSLAGSGTVGLGGGAQVAILSPTTKAQIGDALVQAKRDVAVTAHATEDLVGASASAAVSGEVALAGGLSAFVLNTDTEATIGGGAIVDALGNVAVVADDVTRTSTLAGTVAIGGGTVGAGGSSGLTLITKQTNAAIGDGATVVALGQGTS